MTQYYPVFLDLRNQDVLVVGGGSVAARKVRTLLEHEARVRVVSPQIVPELGELVDGERCSWVSREYADGDIQGAVIVFSCTEKEDVNAAVAEAAKTCGRPVNVVDDPEKCSFIVPSILERGDLCIAVSTGGASPMVARQIREELERIYGQELAEYIALLGAWRPLVKSSLPAEKRRLFWQRVTDGEVRHLVTQGRLAEAKGVIDACFRSLLA